MPAIKTKLGSDELEGLVRLVRSFRGGRFQVPDDGDETSDSSRTEPAVTSGARVTANQPSQPAEEAEYSRTFFEKLIRWLGKFHPPIVHFPIALLTAAAVAEFLRLVLGKPEFDAISRFCIWFGTLAAVVAGILGWFLAGFRFTDASSVMMTHRWIGTFTVAWAGLVLVLSEMSRHPARHRTRVWFRVTLFVAAGLISVTGFFGGAVVFGIDHYAWPR